MEWIESVFSLKYQTENVSASAAPKTIVVTSSGTPILSVKLSVISVPNTLTSATVSQYMLGTYRLARNWKMRMIARSTPVTTEVPVRPKLRLTSRKSAAVSPTVVQSTLMTQKYSVTSGTLLSRVSERW